MDNEERDPLIELYVTLTEKMNSLQNEYFKRADKSDHLFLQVGEDVSKLLSEKDELVNQLARERILTSDLTNQVVKIKEFLASAELSKESLDELLSKTKEYLIQCSMCKRRINGVMEEILQEPQCNCNTKASWEIMQRIII